MGLFDTVTVDVLSAAFKTKQLGEAMLTHHLGEDSRLVAPSGREIAFHGLLHLLGDDGAEFMAVFIHGAGITRPDRGGSLRHLPAARPWRAVGAA